MTSLLPTVRTVYLIPADRPEREDFALRPQRPSLT
jgi:hypothetical protein